jgi:hypothetical protein
MTSTTQPNQLYGQTGPEYVLKREKAKHRLMAEMHLNGFTNLEIAEAFKCTAVAVAYTLKQSWLIDYMTQRAAESGEDEREKMAANGRAAMSRIVEMSELCHNPGVKFAANKELVDRWIGKTPQTITHINKNVTEQTDEELMEGVQAVLKERAKPRQVVPDGVPTFLDE